MNSEKGFTLVEMLVTTAIFGVVIIGVVISYQQIVSATMRNNRQTMAVSDVSMAALEIHKDLFMALTIDVSDNDIPPNYQLLANNTPVEVTDSQSVRLTWFNYISTNFDDPEDPPPEGGVAHAVTYSMAGTVLTRSYDGVDWIVGRQVSYLAFTRNGADITVEITSTVAGPPEESETLIFTIHLRGEGALQ